MYVTNRSAGQNPCTQATRRWTFCTCQYMYLCTYMCLYVSVCICTCICICTCASSSWPISVTVWCIIDWVHSSAHTPKVDENSNPLIQSSYIQCLYDKSTMQALIDDVKSHTYLACNHVGSNNFHNTKWKLNSQTPWEEPVYIIMYVLLSITVVSKLDTVNKSWVLFEGLASSTDKAKLCVCMFV